MYKHKMFISALMLSVSLPLSVAIAADVVLTPSVSTLGGIEITNGQLSVSETVSDVSDAGIVVGSFNGTVDDHWYSGAAMWDAAGVPHMLTDTSTYTYTSAADISADGSTIVGNVGLITETPTGLNYREKGAVLNSTDGVYLLPTASDDDSSYANGVSDDGKVIAGYAYGNDGAYAIRWESDGMTVLDHLASDSQALALGVSGDGNVVVGRSLGEQNRAVRWLGNQVEDISGGANSEAVAANFDGSVVAGNTFDNGQNAFRWNQENGAVSLGNLHNGNWSRAADISSNGSVIVGQAADGSVVMPLPPPDSMAKLAPGKSSNQRGFRWTEATGMQSVEEWLTASGLDVGDMVTANATGVSNDGSVVVGQLENGHAYIARVKTTVVDPPIDPTDPTEPTEPTTGIIDTVDYSASLAGVQAVNVVNNQVDVSLNGAHGSPLRGLPKAGKWVASVGGDISALNSDDSAQLGEITLGYGFSEDVAGRLSIGATKNSQDLVNGGTLDTDSMYVIPEVSAALSGPLRVTVSGYYGHGNIDFARAYLNGAGIDTSYGSSDFNTYGARVRLDWVDAFSVADAKFTPYLSLTHTTTNRDGYTEVGGSFPVVWDAAKEHANVVRLGTDAVYELNSTVTLLAKAEVGHRFENANASSSGTIIGLSDFTIPGADLDQNWVRGGFGAEIKAGPGVASFMVNATTSGSGMDGFIATNYRVEF